MLRATEKDANKEADSAKGKKKAAKQLEHRVKEAKEALRRNKEFRRWFHREYKPDQTNAETTQTFLASRSSTPLKSGDSLEGG